MEKNNNKPKLRFPGFNEPWEQRKLKQLANFAKGQGYSKNDLTDVGTPIILYGRLYTKYQSTISEVDTFAVAKSGSIYSTGEEVIVPASGETAEDIARASAVVKSGFLLGGDLNIIYPNKDVSTIFLALSISNGKQQKELSKKAQGKSVVHLHNSDLEDITISFPCREEQEKIGSLFGYLDSLIALYQRKSNHLQDKKKSLLQKMFPKNGEDFPELRFPGFTDPWEQRKLGEITSKIGDGLHGTPQYSEKGNVYFINGNNLVDGKIIITDDTKRVTEKEQSLDDMALGKNTILMSINGTIGNLALYNGEKLMLGKSASHITTDKSDRNFLFYALQTKSVRDYFFNSLTGTTIKNLGLKTIRDTKIFIPNLQEQEKIGVTFSYIDNLITLHQCKLSHLQQQKKALLQQMFV